MPGSHACDVLLATHLDESGKIVYGTAEDVDQIIVEQVWPTFFGTALFEKLQASYLWDESAQNRLIALFDKRFGESSIVTCWKLEEVLGDMLATRDPALHVIPRAPVAPEPPQLREARERKNLRAEVEADVARDSGTSVEEIKQKRKNKPGYAAAYKEVMYPAAPESTLPAFSQELNDFAIAYNNSTLESMKLVGGMRRVGEMRYGSDTFEKMLEQASAYGLIRG
jgi:hypothetical protein